MQNSLKSASSIGAVTLKGRLKEALALARMHLAKRKQRIDFTPFVKFADEYESYAQKYLGKDLRSLKVVEIGYGARPLRLSWLYSLGVDVTGIDLDSPVLSLSFSALHQTLRKNGIERALKSAARQIITGQKEYTDLGFEFERRHPNVKLAVPAERLLVGNAADPALWSRLGPVQLIYSEDVFEHIPLDSIPQVLDQIHHALSPGGIALIRPSIFTGIAGGHNVEWYPHTLDKPLTRSSKPWEHLRENRFPANTYLNSAGFATYVELFKHKFETLEIDKGNMELGMEFLDEETRAALSSYSDEDLMLNSVLFVLRPLP